MTSTSRIPIPTTATPTRYASGAEPFSTTPTAAAAAISIAARRSILLRTPGSQARGRLSTAATPHARAAQRAIDSRRAALLTPHRARRRSVREVRDSPRDFLLNLGRVLARTTQPITTSSSASSTTSSPAAAGRDGDGSDDEPTLGRIRTRPGEDDDDDDEALPKRPRLSLPIADEDEDGSIGSDELRPHRSVLIDDDNNFTMDMELPRREVAGGQDRFSLGSARMSDYFATHDMLHSEDVGVDSGFFPPRGMLEDAAAGMTIEVGEDLASPERLDVEPDQRNRDSDFAFEVPLGEVNESTFVMAPEVQESPDRTAAPIEDDEPIPEADGGFAPLMDQRSDDFDIDQDLGPVPALDDEPEPDMTRNTAWTEGESMISAMRSSIRGLPKKTIRISKHGIEYPSLPASMVKRLAQNFAKASGINGNITPDALRVIMQASDWFFEQLGDDLAAYADHAGRKTIDESDVLTLMKRQRQINPRTTLFSLAQRHLPRELLQEVRMPPPIVPKKRRKPKGGTGDENVT
ncbi:hypothetical protein VTJ83DRAFT_1728 [Remersonia thermophila]|uniref:CENP-T/Histone H4 histone fold domain-containing protein n=1 Tax=Remersonia thermophila TaxID=72144 RepID=A0ABR4DGY0_9PEZI